VKVSTLRAVRVVPRKINFKMVRYKQSIEAEGGTSVCFSLPLSTQLNLGRIFNALSKEFSSGSSSAAGDLEFLRVAASRRTKTKKE
jgi:hypothetical protein